VTLWAGSQEPHFARDGVARVPGLPQDKVRRIWVRPAERAQWQRRPSPRPDRNGDTLSGRGIAYAQRSGAVVAIVA